MTFISNLVFKGLAGDKWFSYGTFTNGVGDEGGDIDTQLDFVEICVISHTGTTVTTNGPVIDETFPVDGSKVTIVTDSGVDGTWIAFGKT